MNLIIIPVICQPRPVAGFRGTVRYASVNAHKNKVGFCPEGFNICLFYLCCLYYFQYFVDLAVAGSFYACIYCIPKKKRKIYCAFAVYKINQKIAYLNIAPTISVNIAMKLISNIRNIRNENSSLASMSFDVFFIYKSFFIILVV